MKNAPPWHGGARASKKFTHGCPTAIARALNRFQVRTAAVVNPLFEGDPTMTLFVCLSKTCGEKFQSADRYPSCPYCGCVQVTTTRVPPPTQVQPNSSERANSAATPATDSVI